jgi:hypothetical protein
MLDAAPRRYTTAELQNAHAEPDARFVDLSDGEWRTCRPPKFSNGHQTRGLWWRKVRLRRGNKRYYIYMPCRALARRKLRRIA